MKALCKKQTTLQAAVYLEFPAPGDKLSLALPPSQFVAAYSKRNTAVWCFTCNYLIPRTKFSCFCCWKFIDYFVNNL